MLIYHDSAASALSHSGVDYTAERAGRIRDAADEVVDVPVFDVPQEVGVAVSRFAGWHAYTGDPEPTADEQAAADKAELLARVAELEAQLADINSAKARGPRKAGGEQE